ncbi:MAG: carboxylating nicotinate-nucleotide diphosphorylase [Deltaproteobacteria bacterium]|nr:carboxylating nicotinate-nucleotide diphosphorylase [Deltaproteobacteria bacterium]
MNVDSLIKSALHEDIGKGDITSAAIIPPPQKTNAVIAAKQEMVLAGINIAAKAFKMADKRITIKIKKKDGDRIKNKEIIAELSGPARSILAAERTALNFLQHLSGIATLTDKYAKAVRGTGAKILDTRKTIPGWRCLEKYAVRMGDGKNHRYGLYDMFLIKNNHADAAGSVTEAIYRVQNNKTKIGNLKKLLIECEVRNISELEEAIVAGADIIMLDNFTPKMTIKAVKLAKKLSKIVKKQPKLEVSGGISLKNIKKYAKTGVDYISVGAITHSAPTVDIHLILR